MSNEEQEQIIEQAQVLAELEAAGPEGIATAFENVADEELIAKLTRLQTRLHLPRLGVERWMHGFITSALTRARERIYFRGKGIPVDADAAAADRVAVQRQVLELEIEVDLLEREQELTAANAKTESVAAMEARRKAEHRAAYRRFLQERGVTLGERESLAMAGLDD